MKKLFGMSCVLALAAMMTAVGQEARRFGNFPSITVQGQGEVSAKPDFATVRLGAEAQADTAADAQKAVNEVLNAALEAVQELGVEEKNIRTTGLNVYPVYANQRPNTMRDDDPRIAGYRASNVVQVELSDLELVGKVVDAGMKAGLNRVEGIDFELRNDLPHRQEALRKASREARAKAEAIAEAMDVQLGSVLSVHEGGGEAIPYAPRMGRMATMAMAAESTPVQPGEIRLQETVSVTYSMRR